MACLSLHTPRPIKLTLFCYIAPYTHGPMAVLTQIIIGFDVFMQDTLDVSTTFKK